MSISSRQLNWLYWLWLDGELTFTPQAIARIRRTRRLSLDDLKRLQAYAEAHFADGMGAALAA